MRRTTPVALAPEEADPSQHHQKSLSLYLHEIGAMAPLSQTEGGDLIKRARAGDVQAKHRLIEANLRLVVFVAKRYRPYLTASLDLLDLIQAGNLGLMRAVDCYDPVRGCFSTHAVYWIRQAISRAVTEQGRTIRVPAYLHTQLGRMACLALRFLEEQAEETSAARLAEAMGSTVEQVRLLIQADTLPISLDLPIYGEDEEPASFGCLFADSSSPDPETALLEQEHARERCEQIMAALACLTEREREAIILRFGLDGSAERTLEQVGACMGIGKKRVWQLEGSALAKLRDSVHAPVLLQTLRAVGEAG